MFRNRIWMYGALLFILTGTILVTQVSWILESARIEESSLNQRVNTALCNAMEVLSKDKAICSGFESCTSHAPGTFEMRLTQQEKEKIDSVILQHLKFYNINVPFQTSFSPYTKGMNDPLPINQALLFPPAKAGMQNILVHIEIPSKSDLIRAQINGTFILSMIVLALLVWLFFSTLRGLYKERKIRKDTIDFINTMAHDLKTPISNISIATALLMKETHHDNQYISIINAENNRLKQRARQILGVASIDAMLEEETNKTQVDIHELIRQSLESFSLKIRDTKGEIGVRLEATQHVVRGNLVQLTSAVVNIIDNAFTYSHGSPMIQVKTDNQDSYIRIEIEDKGPGIPLQEQELIFKKGYRVHNGHSKEEGYGLGLYLAKTLVEKQGGNLSLFSDGSSGSCFIIQLPV